MEWSNYDKEQADRQGWGLYAHINPSTGVPWVAIEATMAGPSATHPLNIAAVANVHRRAEEGDALALHALACIAYTAMTGKTTRYTD